MNEQISIEEIVKLGAVDSDFFGRTFFPRAIRQRSPVFDKAIWAALENPNHRFLNLRVFRGGAKTTRLRVFTAKRIAYNVSKTILYVGASESHAVRSVQWIRGQIEAKIQADGSRLPTKFAQVFGLRPGRKWAEHEFEVFHGVDEQPIWVLGVGITGTVRGINFDDYRPDLIIVDDCVTDENAATQPQSEKINDLVLNAIANSLASKEEAPNAKLAMLQTPISPYDVSVLAEQDSEWHTENFGCWTPETAALPTHQQVSSWPELFPTEDLRLRKENAISMRRYSGFAREMEVKLVQAESNSFNKNWLRFRDPMPKGGATVISIDPVPPPSETQMAKALQTKDFEAISVVSRNKGDYNLLEYQQHRGHEPDWTSATVFEMISRYRPMALIVEAVAAQRYLKWFLQQEMQRRRVFVPILETPNDQRSKFLRIVTSLNGVASSGHLYCSKEHSDFILAFETYGPGFKGSDDLLDSVSVGVSYLANPMLELGQGEYEELLDHDLPKLSWRRGCP